MLWFLKSGAVIMLFPRMATALDPFRFVIITVAGWMNQRQTNCTNFCTNYYAKPCETASGSTTAELLFSITCIFRFAQLRLEIRLLTEGSTWLYPKFRGTHHEKIARASVCSRLLSRLEGRQVGQMALNSRVAG